MPLGSSSAAPVISPGPSFFSQAFLTLDFAFGPGLALAMGLAVSKGVLFYAEAIGNLPGNARRGYAKCCGSWPTALIATALDAAASSLAERTAKSLYRG